MKRIIVIVICLLGLVVLADRRSQLMSQRQLTTSSGYPFAPPTSTGPGIWLDVIEQVTNGLADFTVVSNKTNYGFLPGYFNVDTVSAFTTNNIYRTIGGGALTSIPALSSPGTGFRWFTNGVDANNQCYFQSNFGTMAIRISCKNYTDVSAPIQTGTTAPTGPGPGYAYPHIFSGTIRFDWGQPGAVNRLSITPPAGTENTWLNIVYVKSNDLMQCWIAGTNFIESTGHTTENLFPTNNYAGPLTLLGSNTLTNYLCKRILFWRTVLTPTEIASLNTWMTAMP